MSETETSAKFTPGPWHPGHLGDPTSTCNCKSVVSEIYAGGICEIDVWNGIKSISDGGNDAPPETEAVANMHLIAAAPDLYAACEALCQALEIAPEFRESALAKGFDALEKARGKLNETQA